MKDPMNIQLTSGTSFSRSLKDLANLKALSPALKDQPITMSGYLIKMKKNGRKLTPDWNRRWFALVGRDLQYYHSKRSNGPANVIDLLSITSVGRYQKDSPTSFIVKTERRNYQLRAESESDMKRWVRGLLEQQELWRKKTEGDVTQENIRSPKHYRDDDIKPDSARKLGYESKSSTSMEQEEEIEERPSPRRTKSIDSNETGIETRRHSLSPPPVNELQLDDEEPDHPTQQQQQQQQIPENKNRAQFSPRDDGDIVEIELSSEEEEQDENPQRRESFEDSDSDCGDDNGEDEQEPVVEQREAKGAVHDEGKDDGDEHGFRGESKEDESVQEKLHSESKQDSKYHDFDESEDEAQEGDGSAAVKKPLHSQGSGSRTKYNGIPAGGVAADPNFLEDDWDN